MLITLPAVTAIAIFYGINDLDAVQNSSGSFPLAQVYHQATANDGATFGKRNDLQS